MKRFALSSFLLAATQDILKVVTVRTSKKVLFLGGLICLLLSGRVYAQSIGEIIDKTGDGLGNTLEEPLGIAVDDSGNVYVAGAVSDNVFRIAKSGLITVIIDETGDGAGHTLDAPVGVALDGLGNVFVTGSQSNNVFKITPEGFRSEVIDVTGDGIGSSLLTPRGVVVNDEGSVFVAGWSSDNVFKISQSGEILKIIDAVGDGIGNLLDSPNELALDSAGNLYVTGRSSNNVFQITSSGLISQIIDETGDSIGNSLEGPYSVDVDRFGAVFVAGFDSRNAFEVSPNGVITEIIDATGDGNLTLGQPFGIVVGDSGDVFVMDRGSHRVFRVDSSGTITKMLGDGCGSLLNFPQGIAISGTRHLYVANGFFDNVIEYAPTQNPWSETETKLIASDFSLGDKFGLSVSISGNTAIIASGGSAYIYLFDGSNWIEDQKLLSGNTEFTLGGSVEISDSRLIVRAADNTGRGAVYVFRFDGSSWVEEQVLQAEDGSALDSFGISLSIDGDRIVVGRYTDPTNGDNSGSVYVYSFDGTSWIQEAKLLPDDGDAQDFFGRSVSVDGDRLVVGAFGDEVNGDNSGSIYYFRFDGSTWIQEQRMLALDGESQDRFGQSISMDGDRLIASAPNADNNSGSVYVFRFDGSSWLHDKKLKASDGCLGEKFGESVSIDDDWAVVGAPSDIHDSIGSGSAYFYRFVGEHRAEEFKLTAADIGFEDHFGWSVSINQGRSVVGSWLDDHDDKIDAGSAYIYELTAYPVGIDPWEQRDVVTPSILSQSYPNPFTQKASIEYELSSPAYVWFEIADIVGRRVTSVVAGDRPAGKHVAQWNGRSSTGANVASGVYLYKIIVVSNTNVFTETGKMLLVR